MNAVKIKQLCEAKGWSIHHLAKKAGVSHTILYHLLSGKKKDIKLQTAFKIADVLGVDVNEFR